MEILFRFYGTATSQGPNLIYKRSPKIIKTLSLESSSNLYKFVADIITTIINCAKPPSQLPLASRQRRFYWQSRFATATLLLAVSLRDGGDRHTWSARADGDRNYLLDEVIFEEFDCGFIVNSELVLLLYNFNLRFSRKSNFSISRIAGLCRKSWFDVF